MTAVHAEEIAGQAQEGEHQSVGLIIAAVALVLFISSLGQTIVSTALPTIVGELGGAEHLSWLVTAFLLASTVVAPIYGKLGDLYGRKIVLQAAIVIFLAGSIIAGLANSMLLLIIARAVQGLGGGGLMVVAMTVIADVVAPRDRGRIQGVFGGVFGISTVLGPLIGGFTVEHFSWHWIFFFNIPLGVIALAIIGMAFKQKPQRVQHRIDYLGAALLTGALSAVVLFTSLGGATFAWDSLTIIGLIVASVVLTAGFIAVELRAAEPILPMDLFFNNAFSVTSAIGFVSGTAMFGAITFMPLYLQVVQGISPTQSGLQLLPMMLGLIGMSTLAGQVMSRTGSYKPLMIVGTIILTVGMVLLATLDLVTPAWQVSLYMFIAGAGLGPLTSVSVTAVQNAVERRHLGVATAANTMFRQIGGSIGVSLFGSIFASGLASQLGAVMAEGGSARSTVSAAAIAAMPPQVRDLVLDAFVNALHPIFYLAAVAGGIAFLLSLLLKQVPLASSLRKEPEAEVDAEEAASAAVVGAPATVR